MSNQERGFSGVGKLSTSQDSLIPPQILAQVPSWNPLKQSAAQAKQSHWKRLRNQVKRDDQVQSQDSLIDQHISSLEQQFVQRVQKGESLQTDQDLFPESSKESAFENEAAASLESEAQNNPYSTSPKYGNSINWSAWAAAVCLVLVGLGSFGMWLFSGRPEVSGMIERFTSDFALTESATPANGSSNGSSRGNAGSNGSVVAAGAGAAGIGAPTAQTPGTQVQNAAAQAAMLFEDEISNGTPSGAARAARPAAAASIPSGVSAAANATGGAGAAGAAAQALALFEDEDSGAISSGSSAGTAGSGDKAQASDAGNAAPSSVASAPNSGISVGEQIYLSPITELTSDTVLSINLPVLPALKRPSDQVVDKDNLSPSEYRWCALVQMGSTEVGSVPSVCSSQNVLRYAQDIVPYLPYLKVLGLYRALVEQKRDLTSIGAPIDGLEAQQWMDYQLTSPQDQQQLNERDTHHCGQSWVVINGYFAMSQFGLSVDAINRQIQHFNTKCSQKLVSLAQQSKWMQRDDLLVFVQAMLIANFEQLTQNWTQFTYLPPAKGTAQQRRNEIKEAQQMLKQLGYRITSADGIIGDQTRIAIRNFEQDMGLNETGDLTFSLLLRLKLMTQGYDSKQTWKDPLQKSI